MEPTKQPILDALSVAGTAIEAERARQKLQLGDGHFAVADFGAAATAYQDAIWLDPTLAEAHFGLGLALRRLGHDEQAMAAYRHAIELRPDYADAHFNLGIALRALGQLDAAADAYRQSIAARPEFADAHNNLGNVLLSLRQAEAAVEALRRAAALRPDHAEAHFNLGRALRALGRQEEALTSYRQSIALRPERFEAHVNLGNLLKELGRVDEADAAYRHALELKPDSPEAHLNWGKSLYAQGRSDEAVAAFRKAILLKPAFADAYNSLGATLRRLGRLDEAEAAFADAIRHQPDFADAHHNLGLVLKDFGRLDQAAAACRRAIALRPDHVGAHSTLGAALMDLGLVAEAAGAIDRACALPDAGWEPRLARVMAQLPILYDNQVEIATARRRYANALDALVAELAGANPAALAAAADAVGSRQPFYLAYQGDNDRDLQILYGGLVCRLMAARHPQWAARPPMPPLRPGEPIRVGVCSGYFRLHSVWKLFRGWVKDLDRRRFRLFGYSTSWRKDNVTKGAMAFFDAYHEQPDSSEAMGRRIRADALHVLIYPEIGMDPMTVRLAASRLAPVQCVAWGHPDTTGLPTIDYFLSSDLMEPPEAERHYSETLIRLPNLSINYRPFNVEARAVDLAAHGVRADAVTYLCCQSLYKYLPQHDAILPAIAARVPQAQFLFIAHHAGPVTEAFKRRLDRAFAEAGLDSGRHVVILPRLKVHHYAGLNHQANVYLDSIGWSGGNTTLEAIAAGLPVVTLPGRFMRGRHSYAILTMMGVSETIAKDRDDYVAIAARLGNDAAWRRTIAETMAARHPRIQHDRDALAGLEAFIDKIVSEQSRDAGHALQSP